jgi:nitrate reductase gamma subunit
MKNKRLIGIILAVVIILLVPLIAMQFTDDVNWTLIDFVIAGGLLLGVGLLGELVIRKVRNSNQRAAILVTLLVVLILVWIELAVGIFGTPFAGS